MDEAEEPTCGNGLAANTETPALMAQVLAATARVLENHIRALDTREANGMREIAAYERLARDHRDAGARLTALAAAMQSYRDLPMAEHDIAALSDARSTDVLDALVQAPQSLAGALARRSEEYAAMLRQIKGG